MKEDSNIHFRKAMDLRPIEYRELIESMDSLGIITEETARK
jgi:uncharacterized protein YutE (UPF0331/DUF86 family)